MPETRHSVTVGLRNSNFQMCLPGRLWSQVNTIGDSEGPGNTPGGVGGLGDPTSGDFSGAGNVKLQGLRA